MRLEADVAAVVAHGLIGTLAVVSGAADLLGPTSAVDEQQRHELSTMLIAQLGTFNEGLRVLLEDCSDAFGDAATRLAVIATTFRDLGTAERALALASIISSASVLNTGLGALVRGLSSEVVAMLDSLQRVDVQHCGPAVSPDTFTSL